MHQPAFSEPRSFGLTPDSRPWLRTPDVMAPKGSDEVLAKGTYAVVAFFYWILCFSISRVSLRLEQRLDKGRS